MMYRYRLISPIEQSGIVIDPAATPEVSLRADQAERLAAAGIIIPGAAAPDQTQAPRQRGRKQEH